MPTYKLIIGQQGPFGDNFRIIRAEQPARALHWAIDNLLSDEASGAPGDTYVTINLSQIADLVDLIPIVATPEVRPDDVVSIFKDAMLSVEAKLDSIITSTLEERPDEATIKGKVEEVLLEVIRASEEPVHSSPSKAIKAAKPAKPKQQEVRRFAAGKMPPGELTIDQAMEFTGLKRGDVQNRLNWGTLTRGTVRGSVTEASVRDWKARGGKSAEVKSSADRIAKMNAARKANRPPPKPINPNTNIRAEDFVNEEKLAKELGMSVGKLNMIKSSGNVPGGFGWVDRAALKAYMASPEFEDPLS